MTLRELIDGGHPGLWWTAAEIASARITDTPDSLRGVRALAEREGWAAQGPEKARLRRGARGGAMEYHRDLLPARARTAILAALAPKTATPAGDRIAAWAAWDAAPQARRERALARVKAVADSDALKAGGMALKDAVAAAAGLAGVAPGSLWRWRALVKDARRDDWPAVLLPKHGVSAPEQAVAQAAGEAPDQVRGSARAEVAEADWEYFVSDYLRPERPALAACFRRVSKIAASEGRSLPCERSLRRRLDREVPRAVQVMAREGLDAVKRLYPAQERDKSALHALEAVNADGHTFDVFVRWRDGYVGRPAMVALHDIYSGMFLSWRLHRAENSVAVLLALGDMVEDWGIPDHVLFDNGRAFACKDITGGIPNRYRFKVKADDPLGVLPILGCTVHWATPYAGQSKPIERAFRDLCEDISRGPRCAGAYTGNRPDAKPENYGNRAIDIEEFEQIVADGIAEHNARSGRKAAVCAGRSFLEVFTESYAQAPIRRATEAQRRLWLLGVQGLRASRDSGEISLHGNRYWCAAANGWAGEKVQVRFDPENLHSGVHVYAADGRYLGHADCIDKTGFFDADAAASHARARKTHQRAVRDDLAALRTMTAIELGAKQAGLAAGVTPPRAPERRVVRAAFGRGGTALKIEHDADDAAAPDADVVDLGWARAAMERGLRLAEPANED